MNETSAPSSPSLRSSAGTYAWYVVLVLLLCQTLSSMDAKLPFIMVQSLKHELLLSDTQIGFITGPAFSLTYAVFALPIAKLSDRHVRKYVILAAILIWSVFTAVGGLAAGFAAFAMSRIGVALGEAALVPASNSLIASFMPIRLRPRAVAIYGIGTALGSYLALAAGGWMNDHYGWRSALFAVGILGGLVAIVVLTTLREPPRGQVQAAVDFPKGNLRSLFKSEAVRNLIIGATILGFTTGAINGWGPTYVMRTYHLSAAQVGATFGAAIGLIAIFGTLSGGFLNGLVGTRGYAGTLQLVALSVLLSTFVQVASLFSGSYSLFILLTATTILLIGLYFAPTYAAVQSLVHPQARSFAAAVTIFGVNGLGFASGAFVTGLLSDRLSALGLRGLWWGLFLTALPRAFSALFYYKAAISIRKLSSVQAA